MFVIAYTGMICSELPEIDPLDIQADNAKSKTVYRHRLFERIQAISL